MYSVLIVGCGSIGERHLRCFKASGRATVTACDSNPELLNKIRDFYGAVTFEDFNQALAGDVDVVVICTPANFHIPMALQALCAGKHVLIEKPLSTSFEGVDQLLTLHAQSSQQVAVAYVQHVLPFLSKARDFLRSGELGPIKHVTLKGGQHFPTCRPAHTAPYAQTYYRDRNTGGGAIQDALTHTVNWVESVLGPTDSVFCDCAHQVLSGVTVEDTVNLTSRHGDTLVSYTLNQFQAPNESFAQFNTAKGSVKIEYHRQRWGTFQFGDTEWTWREDGIAERDGHFTAQANAFLDQIDGKPSPLCSLEAAAQTLRFNLAALASADSDQRVHCRDFG